MEIKAWPLFVRPKEDEILSSWIYRLAQKHGIHIHSFCKEAFGEIEILNRDIDLSAGEELKNIISKGCDTTVERARDTLLSSYEGVFFNQINEHGINKWILSKGVYHRIRKRKNLQVCPSCWRKDEQPYVRKKWRLSLTFMCLDCNKILIESCPKCNAAISYFRHSIGKKTGHSIPDLSICHQCFYDISLFKNKKVEELRSMQEWYYTPFIHRQDYPHLFYDALFTIVSSVLCASRKKTIVLQKLICKELNIPFKKLKGGYSNYFNYLPIKERIYVLKLTYWLLQDWPYRFIDTCKESKCYSAEFLKDDPDQPYWLWKVLRENLFVKYTSWKDVFPQYSYLPSYNSLAKYLLRKQGSF